MGLLKSTFGCTIGIECRIDALLAVDDGRHMVAVCIDHMQSFFFNDSQAFGLQALADNGKRLFDFAEFLLGERGAAFAFHAAGSFARLEVAAEFPVKQLGRNQGVVDQDHGHEFNARPMRSGYPTQALLSTLPL